MGGGTVRLCVFLDYGIPIWVVVLLCFFDWWVDIYCGGVNWCCCVDCGFMVVN